MSLHLSTSISSAVIHAFLISYLNKPPTQFPHIHCESSPIPSSRNIQKSLHSVLWYGNIVILLRPSVVLFCSLEKIDENTQHPGPLTSYVNPHDSSWSSLRFSRALHFLQSQVLLLGPSHHSLIYSSHLSAQETFPQGSFQTPVAHTHSLTPLHKALISQVVMH